MKNLNYPLDFKFKITTLASDFNITDRDGKHIAYVRQKMFKLKKMWWSSVMKKKAQNFSE